MRVYKCCVVIAVVFALPLNHSLNASQDTIGPNGINSVALNLTGDGIAIGQVEALRPGKPDFDTDPMCCNETVDPTGVFVLDMAANINQGLSLGHAVWVAGVMISTETEAAPGHNSPPTGVATDAALYSSGFAGTMNFQADAAIAAQHIATVADVRATNFSFAAPFESVMELNGNALLTLFVDWSASQFQHDVLYVVAGLQGMDPEIFVPTDNYNGITVGISSNLVDGEYRQVAALNNFTKGTGDRVLTDILAPGIQIDLAGINGTVPPEGQRSGSSYSAPHVTGTVALLQEHAENQIMAVGAPRWTPNARRHEVMKAVLMNSADKVEDPGDGTLLGMTRTVIDRSNQDWLQSEAFTDDMLPLDDQMGVGHLNAKRAFQQFEPGEYGAGAGPVPAVGWDLGFTDGFADIQEYSLAQAIPEGQFVSMTLAWDREVFLNDNDADLEYDIGETFIEDAEPIDLNLYLMPQGSTDVSQYAARSIADDTSVEHVFFEVDSPGMYEIWVEQASGTGLIIQDYALAWWMAPIPLSPTEQGDYSGNGTVGPEDYDIWANNFGTDFAAADGNGNGIVDAADYTVWRDHLGQTLGSSSLATVPEPDSLCLVFLGLAMSSRHHSDQA